MKLGGNSTYLRPSLSYKVGGEEHMRVVFQLEELNAYSYSLCCHTTASNSRELPLPISVAPHGSSAYVILLIPAEGRRGSSYSHFECVDLQIWGSFIHSRECSKSGTGAP